MSTESLPANSLAEIYLYLMIAQCAGCGRGPLKGGDATPEPPDTQNHVGVEVTCGSCRHRRRLVFALPDGTLAMTKAALPGAPARVNPTDQPSRIIDVLEWVNLFRMISRAAAENDDKVEARLIAYEAAQCLDEALKFYDEDNDLPPESALFSDASRRHVREHPHSLARSRLVNLRAKLPAIDAMERSMEQRRGKNPWWKVWGR